jgi:2-polyprenyl-3-methyl-5-hydroxy-6-metoxy-1,4-benzoquinol methylase
MSETINSKKLSEKEYWDEVLIANKLPRINSPKAYTYRVTMDFIDPFIDANKKTFFEVGCGTSGWLPYFAKKYNLLVSGLDYSEVGCRLAEENLKLQNIKFGEIICKDFFLPDCTNGKTYDVVFSYGVIEHFDRPEDLAKIFSSFIKPNGIIITLVPNLNGLIGILSQYFIREVFDIHRVIKPNQLVDYHSHAGLSNQKTGYAGTFSLAVIPWDKSRKGLFRYSWFRKNMVRVIYVADRLLSQVFKLLGRHFPSQFLSPYVISIAKKI